MNKEQLEKARTHLDEVECALYELPDIEEVNSFKDVQKWLEAYRKATWENIEPRLFEMEEQLQKMTANPSPTNAAKTAEISPNAQPTVTQDITSIIRSVVEDKGSRWIIAGFIGLSVLIAILSSLYFAAKKVGLI